MTYTKRDVQNILRANGYILQPGRGKGSHSIYKNGSRTISISNSYNKMIMKRLIKEYGLVTTE